MKKIFISIPWFSPAFKAGGPIQSILQMVEALKGSFQFFIYTSNEDLDSLVLNVQATDEWLDYDENIKVYYSSKENRSQRLIDQIESVRPDILYIVGMFDWHFNIVPMVYAKAAKKIVSVKGMLHPEALMQKSAKKKLFLQAMRMYGLAKKTRFHATDAQEAEYVKNIFGPQAVVEIAGNFSRLFSERAKDVKRKNELKLVSIGIVSPMKNYKLILESLLKVKTNINYTIYGAVKDGIYWASCLDIMKAMPAHINVGYAGELSPDLVETVLHENDVFILPSESENFGHAMAEALSAGLPLLTSENVPWLQLRDASAGINVAKSSDAIAEAIDFFGAMDESEFSAYRKGAQVYLRKRTDRDGLRNAYLGMFGREGDDE